MKSTSDFDPALYQWKPQPAAARFVEQQIDEAAKSSRWLRAFRGRLSKETGTRLIDWLDHIVIEPAEGLADVGFVAVPDQPALETYEHPAGLFPRIVIADKHARGVPILSINVESLDDFLAVHSEAIRSKTTSGQPGDPFRFAAIHFYEGGTVHVVERHGYGGFDPNFHEKIVAANEVAATLADFHNRNRSYENPATAFADATERFQHAADAIGRNHACDLFFRAEREFWQARNAAARIQYHRQQSLGLGWANHDHHTYRCSRLWFAPLIRFLELTGFQCRERFYAGSDAGWGAQVLEHRHCGIVIFADVDMSEEEVAGDFAHEGLEAKNDLGTVGLWCQLHGDSFVAAGLHHLECQFDFDAACVQLRDEGIETMAPFTDFPYLKQAFTRGERWKVPTERLSSLLESDVISNDDARRFEKDLVIGSHLEILERNDGYKGFNQTGISKIILETNPKTAV